ncbi:hypothetical protein [Bacillus massilinigeriensis]|nr:hypothetical protein [Bacillus mediterraneensis]
MSVFINDFKVFHGKFIRVVRDPFFQFLFISAMGMVGLTAFA